MDRKLKFVHLAAFFFIATSLLQATGVQQIITNSHVAVIHQLATDNFTRANANPIGTPWFPIGINHTANQFQIQGNFAEVNTLDAVNLSGDYYDGGITWPNDQYSEVTLSTLLIAADYIGAGVRWQTTNLVNGYSVLCGTGANNSFVQKYVNGAGTQIGSNFTVAQNDVIRISVTGTTITVTRNGSVVLTGTDATFASGKPAIVGYVPSTGVGSVQTGLWAGGKP
jgi:hypothetical protein